MARRTMHESFTYKWGYSAYGILLLGTLQFGISIANEFNYISVAVVGCCHGVAIDLRVRDRCCYDDRS